MFIKLSYICNIYSIDCPQFMSVLFRNFVYIPQDQITGFFNRHSEIDRNKAIGENEKIKSILNAEHLCTRVDGIYVLVGSKFSDFSCPAQNLKRAIIKIETQDNLSRIAKKFNLKSWKVIQKLNTIEDPNHIEVGDLYVMPRLPGSFKESSPVQVSNLLKTVDESQTSPNNSARIKETTPILSGNSQLDNERILVNQNPSRDKKAPVQPSKTSSFLMSQVDLDRQRRKSVESFVELEQEMEDSANSFLDTLIQTLVMGTPSIEQDPNSRRYISAQVRNVFGAFKYKTGGRFELKLLGLAGFEKSKGKEAVKFVRLFSETFRIKVDSQGFFHFKAYSNKMRSTGVVGKVYATKFDYTAWKEAQIIAKRDGINAGVKYLEKSNKAFGLSFDPKTTARALQEVPCMREMKALSLASLTIGIGFAAILSYLDTKFNLKLTPSTRAFLVNAMSEAAIGLLRKRGVASLAGVFSSSNAYFFALFECWGLVYDIACEKLGWDKSPLGRGITQAIGTIATRFGYYKLKDVITDLPPPGDNFFGGATTPAISNVKAPTVSMSTSPQIHTSRPHLTPGTIPNSTPPIGIVGTGITAVAGANTLVNLAPQLALPSGQGLVSGIQSGWNSFVNGGAEFLAKLSGPQLATQSANSANVAAKAARSTNTTRNIGLMLRNARNGMESINAAKAAGALKSVGTSGRAAATAAATQAGNVAASVTAKGIARCTGYVLLATQLLDYLAEKFVGEERAAVYHTASQQHFEKELNDPQNQGTMSQAWITAKKWTVLISGINTMHGNSVVDDNQEIFNSHKKQIIAAGENGVRSIRRLIPYLVVNGFYIPTPTHKQKWTRVRDINAELAIMDILKSHSGIPELTDDDMKYMELVESQNLPHDDKYKKALHAYIILSLKGAISQVAFASHISIFRKDSRHQDVLKYVDSGTRVENAPGLLVSLGLEHADKLYARAHDLRMQHRQANLGRYNCLINTCIEDESKPKAPETLNAANIFEKHMVAFVETPEETLFKERMLAEEIPNTPWEAVSHVSEQLVGAYQDHQLRTKAKQESIESNMGINISEDDSIFDIKDKVLAGVSQQKKPAEDDSMDGKEYMSVEPTQSLPEDELISYTEDDDDTSIVMQLKEAGLSSASLSSI